jgi:catechol 2,3-dioxygenase
MPAIDPNLRIRSVALAVGELDRSVDFYERVLGLPLLERDRQSARLGWDAQEPALVLERIEAPVAQAGRASGLFHVAWLHDSRAALADTARRIASRRWPLAGASDHGVSEALYLSDPDGLGIEIYSDRPRERWPRRADGRGVEMVTLALDLEDLLAASPGAPSDSMPAATGIGHVHLKVSDLARASAFYRDALGLEEQARMPGAAFLASGGYHHHFGLNTWESAGAGPAPVAAPGLRRVEIELSSAQELERLERALGAAALADNDTRSSHSASEAERELLVRDPDGIALALLAPAGAQAEAEESRVSSSSES